MCILQFGKHCFAGLPKASSRKTKLPFAVRHQRGQVSRERGGAVKGAGPRSRRGEVQTTCSSKLPSPSVYIWIGSAGLPIFLFRQKPPLEFAKLCRVRRGPGSSLWLPRFRNRGVKTVITRAPAPPRARDPTPRLRGQVPGSSGPAPSKPTGSDVMSRLAGVSVFFPLPYSSPPGPPLLSPFPPPAPVFEAARIEEAME